MKRRIICLFVVIAIFSSFSGSVLGTSAKSEIHSVDIISENKVINTATIDDNFADNSVLITLTNKASLELKEYTKSDFTAINCKKITNLSVASQEIVKAKLAVEGTDSVLSNTKDIDISLASRKLDIDAYHQVLCLELEEPGKANVLQAIKTLQNREDVLCAEPNYYLSLYATTPSDPYYSDQTARSIIHLPTAWDISTGTAANTDPIIIGVIDTGIDENHPDLCDIVDYTISRDFSQLRNDGDYTVGLAKDTHGHGSHVAGIIAAKGNNAVGVCGVIWNAKLASLKVANETGQIAANNVILALDYALDINIPIVNFSCGTTEDITSLENKINEYCDEGGLFICSAGNAGTNNDTSPHYPSSYTHPNIISVGAITSSNYKCDFSNYGLTSVDIYAPGYHILSCYSTDCCGGECESDIENENYCYVPDNTSDYEGGYHYLSGTSMAAPFVTGVAALIKAEYPNLTAAQIKERIMTGVRTLSSLSGMCVSGGKLDAYRALHGHSFTYSNITNSTHIRACTCGITRVESHNFTPNGSGYLCLDCGYYTLFIESNSLIVVPETE